MGMSCEEHGGELDLEKGVFLRRREADSGNNSLQSSTGTASSKLSQPPTSFLEEDEADFEEEIPSPEVRIKRPAANTNIIEVRYRERKTAEWGPREEAKSPCESTPDHKCLKEQPVISFR